MKIPHLTILPVVLLAATLPGSRAQGAPGTPEESGLTAKTATFWVNPADTINNTGTESLGVGVSAGGNVIIGWEDDGDGLLDLEAVWTMYDSGGGAVIQDTILNSIDPAYSSVTVTSKFLAFFRADGSAVSGRTSWGPKIKADLFGSGVGMGATAFDLGLEVPELAAIQTQEGGGSGDFPAVQLLNQDGSPVGIVSGASDAFAQTAGDIRIADWDYLSNGNIVIVGESRQGTDLVDKFGGAAAGNHAIFRIVDRAGNEVIPETLVSSDPVANEIWHGVGVVDGGFAVRFNQGGRTQVRMFNNDGTPVTANLDLGTLTGFEIAAGGGRGDGIGFHGNGKNAYVAVNSGIGPSGSREVWMTVLNDDGTVRFSKTVADDLDLTNADRVDAAIDAQGQVFAVFSDAAYTAPYQVVLGRLFNASGEPYGPSFFVSEVETSSDILYGDAKSPRVAMRGGLAAVVWETFNHPVTLDKVIAVRFLGTFRPGSYEAQGYARLVPDTPVIVPSADSPGNWEPYISVLGNSTFLIECNTFAEESFFTAADQRYVVGLQPAAGGAGALGEAFYADAGTPYRSSINASRQNGNPGRVAGDRRPGAVNFMAGGEASLHVIDEFLSDNRWDLGFDRLVDGRFAAVQTFALNTATLQQTPLCKAYDAINGRLTSGVAGGNQIGRFGGDIACLDNGNFVVAVDDRSLVRESANITTAVVLAPDGSVVKDSFVVDPRDTWSNVASYKGGFCVRVHEMLYFYNNAGDLQGSVNQDTSGDSFDTGRGDGTRIAAHINSDYVYLAGKVTTGNLVKVAAWDARDRSFVASASVSEPGFSGDFDRVNLAVDALDRITVAWVAKPPGYTLEQVAARVLKLDGAAKTIDPVTSSFLAFVNASQAGNIRSLGMSVAMTTKEICVAAKGEINLQNQPDLGADSKKEINFYTVLAHPVPLADPTAPVPGSTNTITDVAVDGNMLTLAWEGGSAPFIIESKSSLSDASWATLATTDESSVSVPISGGAGFFRVRSQ